MTSTIFARLFVVFFALGTQRLYAVEAPSEEKSSESFNVTELLLHHVLDSHDWHIVDIPLGGGKYASVSVPLPWLIYDSQKGFQAFFLEGHNAKELNESAGRYGYKIDEHGHIVSLSGATVVDLSPTKTVLHMLIVAA
ncbi:MAG: hypothetical protein RMM53_09445, partial [Bacteroidia bacterium]|nr:hypothetical protein [Bacteroidia bacterium]